MSLVEYRGTFRINGSVGIFWPDNLSYVLAVDWIRILCNLTIWQCIFWTLISAYKIDRIVAVTCNDCYMVKITFRFLAIPVKEYNITFLRRRNNRCSAVVDHVFIQIDTSTTWSIVIRNCRNTSQTSTVCSEICAPLFRVAQLFSGFSELCHSYSDKVGSVVSGKLIIFAETTASVLCGRYCKWKYRRSFRYGKRYRTGWNDSCCTEQWSKELTLCAFGCCCCFFHN